MSKPTEQKIRDLCGLLLTLPGDEIGSVTINLRRALEEHVRLARESLGTQAFEISALERHISDREKGR